MTPINRRELEQTTRLFQRALRENAESTASCSTLARVDVPANAASHSRASETTYETPFCHAPALPTSGKNWATACEGTRERLRAIARAPKVVQELYDQRLLGQIEASRLGLFNPSPDQKAKISKISLALEEQVLVADPNEPPRKLAFRLNRLVQKALGIGGNVDTPPDELSAKIMEAFDALPDSSTRWILRAVKDRVRKRAEDASQDRQAT